MRPRRLVATLMFSMGIVGMQACTTTVVERPGMGTGAGELASIAPQLSVERFLTAVNASDYAAMANLFGNYEGPIERERTELELWMSTLAEVLKHSDYRIVSESREPAREYPTQRVTVYMEIGNEVFPEVPFLVVQSKSGRWLVEEIGVEVITG